MNPILSEILSSPWLISKERSTVYASILLSLIKGESITEVDSSVFRERNRSFVLAAGESDQRFSFSDDNILKNSVAVIPIRSEILKYDQPCGPRGSQSIMKEIKIADSNPNVGSILLLVDSPGGQVTYTDLLSQAIHDCNKPVVAFVEGMAASAAYWIISGCDKIIASSDLDRIGSIGTMLMVEDLKPFFEAQGVKFHEVYATLSSEKNEEYHQVLDGNYDSYRKNVLDVINNKFIASVKENRPSVDPSTLKGKLFFASEAIALGLIDEIGSFDYALSVASSLATASNDFSTKTNNPQNMKIKETWKAIAGFFKLDPANLASEELTEERLQQINDQLSSVTARRDELERLYSAEKSAHEKTKADFEAFKAEDAGTETVAPKAKDRIGNQDQPVYAHDRIADEFFGG